MYKLPAACADLEMHSAPLCTYTSLHMQNHFAHADVGFGRSEKAQRGCKKDSENAFHLLLRTVSAAFGVGCGNLCWRGGGELMGSLPLALHRQDSGSYAAAAFQAGMIADVFQLHA